MKSTETSGRSSLSRRTCVAQGVRFVTGMLFSDSTALPSLVRVASTETAEFNKREVGCVSAEGGVSGMRPLDTSA